MIPLCQKCHGEGKIETTTPENVRFRTYDPCDQCEGSGYDTEWVKCPECNGEGDDPRSDWVGRKCPVCNGYGYVRKVTS